LEAWGRKRRSAYYETDDEMTLSREILVLDFNEADNSKSSNPLNANGKCSCLACMIISGDYAF